MANIFRRDKGNKESVSVQVSQGSALDGVNVTPHNTTNLAKGVTKGIYIGVAGDLCVVLESGVELVFKNLVAGTIHPIGAIRIKSTLTTATNIIAVY